MAIRIVWSPEAIEDLESIIEYISRDSEYYARAVAYKILEISRDISKFPSAGRIVPEIQNKNIREKLIYSYRLVYKVDTDNILIIAIIHGRQLMDNIPERLV